MLVGGGVACVGFRHLKPFLHEAAASIIPVLMGEVRLVAMFEARIEVTVAAGRLSDRCQMGADGCQMGVRYL